ncbi:hypothetical protein E2I00_003772 [Balaenoptera physalus]|uniref:IF rod domain-containing protein n=1 Tax=Balaenoptera physalus TaxID=9770 RepID=A0A643C083_BALPH|nr:hypothetical protein E2I00_003772 [Balaenoptera physalus]
MSFRAQSPFSNYRSLGSVHSAASVYAGAGGSGSRIFVSHSTSVQGGWGSRNLGAGMAGGLVGVGGIQGEKETVQELNDHLASYLERVRSLEADNRRLECKIREHLEKKRPQVRDWGHYLKTIEDLRAQIFASSVDNACLAADDFRVKYEMELATCQSVESDIHRLHKVTDDTSVTWLQLETETKALKEGLLFMKKNHEEEVKGLQNQTANSGLTVELDTPKAQHLSKIMADIRAHTTVVTSQTAETGAAEMTLTELRRTVQSLEIDLDSDKTGLNLVYGSGNCAEHEDVKCVKGYSSNLGNQLGIEGDARVTAVLRFEVQRTGKKLAFLAGEMGSHSSNTNAKPAGNCAMGAERGLAEENSSKDEKQGQGVSLYIPQAAINATVEEDILLSVAYSCHGIPIIEWKYTSNWGDRVCTFDNGSIQLFSVGVRDSGYYVITVTERLGSSQFGTIVLHVSESTTEEIELQDVEC